MKPINLSTDAYSTVRALQFAGKWKRTLVKSVVQRELTSLGFAIVDDQWLVITDRGSAVPRLLQPLAMDSADP
jgi:hypothetical protein